MTIKEEKKPHILEITKAEQYHTVEELFKKSQSDSVYYTLLVLSIFIVATGLLLNNSAVIIGGMLVTPLLTPVLVIGLGLVAGQMRAIKGVLFLMLKSFAAVIIISFMMAFLLGVRENNAMIFENTMRIGMLYFIVAVSAGIAATFAWAHRKVADILPGVAVAVSLVPPLSLVGIQLSIFNFVAVRFYSLIFLFNLMGVIVGSIVVFSLLKFHRAGDKVEMETHG